MTDKLEALKAKKPADTKSLKAQAAGYVTDDNSGGYYVVECQECGEVYPSQECDGGGQIADSGDYNDALCPHCGCESPDECNDTPLAWNVQQAKINALLAALEEKDQREKNSNATVDVLALRLTAQDDHINQQQDRIDALEKKNGELGKHIIKTEKLLRGTEESLIAAVDRTSELERITEGVDQLAIDGGWTARGMSEYAKSLETRNAELEQRLQQPIKLPDPDTNDYGYKSIGFDEVVAGLKEQGFKVEGE